MLGPTKQAIQRCSCKEFRIKTPPGCVLLLLSFLTFSALVASPRKTTLHGGQSRSNSGLRMLLGKVVLVSLKCPEFSTARTAA